jgi:hypothetical protein
MMVRLKPPVLILLPALAAALAGCGTNSQEITIEPWETLLHDLETAWETENISLMEDCFREDFEHHLLEANWDDYNGDGIIDSLWGLEYELELAQTTFDLADSIHFQLTGGNSYEWTGDSTGQTMAMPRIMDREVFSQGGSAVETIESLFLCRPDDQGDWYIWQWWDLSET